MLQTANNLIQGHTSFTFNLINANVKNLSTKSIEIGESEILTYENETAISRLNRFFEESDILKKLSYTLIPAGSLYFKERVLFRFTLTEKYSKHFVLLSGLFGFGKQNGVLVKVNAAERTFAIEVTADKAEQSIFYFEKIFTWLTKEIRFKAALKEVIRLQYEVQKAQAEAFNNLSVSMK